MLTRLSYWYCLRIPPAPALPPPPPPIHPLASRLTLGVGVFKGRNRTSVNLSAGPNDYPESSLSVPNPRRRSVSSPSPQTPRPPHYTPRSETQSSRLGGDSNSATISKLDLISHFESITQLNLKMESGEELTAEDLGRALRYLFSRYHGVLDSVAVFKAQLEEENAELRTRVDTLQQKLRISDTEVSRLRSLLAHYDVSHRLSSESASTVQGYQRTSREFCSQSASTLDGLDFSAATVSPIQPQSSADWCYVMHSSYVLEFPLRTSDTTRLLVSSEEGCMYVFQSFLAHAFMYALI